MRGELGKRKKEKQRVVYGDGSEFRRPGWEEELIDFKKKLRMPSKLIRVAKPSSLSSTPSGKGKEEAVETPPVTAVSPSKTAKENKSPTKVPVPAETPEEQQPPAEKEVKKGRPKGRSPKKGDKEAAEAVGAVAEKEKKGAKNPKGKKNAKKGADSSVPPSPAKVPVVSDEKEKTPAKVRGKKGEKGKVTVIEDPVNGPVVKDERDKGLPLLPIPGPAGLKFNKKMSIKSVFGVDIPTTTPTDPSQSPLPPKKALRRNKFKSGFDYIRKKKKVPSTPDGSTAPPPPKRAKVNVVLL